MKIEYPLKITKDDKKLIEVLKDQNYVVDHIFMQWLRDKAVKKGIMVKTKRRNK